MVVGICHISLVIHGNRSLKGKRQVVKSVTAKVRNRFNVAIAEVDALDVWTRAELGVAAVGNDAAYVNSVLDKVLNFIVETSLAEVTDHEIELINC